MVSALVLAVVLTASASGEAGAPFDAKLPKRLVLRPAADVIVTASFGAGLLLSEIAFKKVLAPSACRWCETNSYDLLFSNVRAPLSMQPTADIGSTVLVITVPTLAVGINLLLASQSGATFGDAAWDVLLVGEATLAAMVLQSTVKFASARERPFVYRLSAADKASTLHPEDNDLSFFSGHTTLAFAAATAAGTIARLRGYKYYWLAWVIGLPLAGLTGFLRMAADKHWFSDVLIGAAVGAASGYFIPTLFHARDDDGGPPRVMVAPMPMGLAVAVRLD